MTPEDEQYSHFIDTVCNQEGLSAPKWSPKQRETGCLGAVGLLFLLLSQDFKISLKREEEKAL